MHSDHSETKVQCGGADRTFWIPIYSSDQVCAPSLSPLARFDSRVHYDKSFTSDFSIGRNSGNRFFTLLLSSLNEPLSFPPTLSSCFSTLLCFQTLSSGPMFMTLLPFLNKDFSTGFVFSRNMCFFLIKDYRKLLNAVTNTMTTTPTTPTATATINSSNTKMESKDSSNFRLMAGWQEEGVKISHEPLSQAHTLLV